MRAGPGACARRGRAAHILDDHHEEGQLDAECLVLVGWARDVVGGHVGAHDLEHARLDVLVCYALDVPVAHLLVPYLQRLAAYTVQDRQKPRLERVLEHRRAGSPDPLVRLLLRTPLFPTERFGRPSPAPAPALPLAISFEAG
jgi:hypothetical protein